MEAVGAERVGTAENPGQVVLAEGVTADLACQGIGGGGSPATTPLGTRGRGPGWNPHLCFGSEAHICAVADLRGTRGASRRLVERSVNFASTCRKVG